MLGYKSLVVTNENSPGWDVGQHDELLLVEVKGSNTIPLCQQAMKQNELEKHEQEERITTSKDKAMYGQYLREMVG